MLKRPFSLLAALLAISGSVLWFCIPGRLGPSLSHRDLTVVKSLVYRHVGHREILPDLSWQSISRLPYAIREAAQIRRARILSIRATGGEVQVEATLPMPRTNRITYGVTCKLRRGTNNWEIANSRIWIGPEHLP
jgi:uncharacterized SAM-binding protein YcdF (DUF218 family)